QQTNENRPPPRALPPQAYIPAHGRADRHPQRGVAPQKSGPVPFRERVPSNLTDLSDSVFEDQAINYGTSRPHGLGFDSRRAHALDSHREFRPAAHIFVKEWHNGIAFRNRFVSPNAYVSVLGRDGELRSSVCERSRRPLWNWTARFCICGERRNIIVKILHHDIGGDMTLGFVSVPLPIEEAHRVDYEMVDLTGTAGLNGEVPIITVGFTAHIAMSMEASDVVRRPSSGNRVQSSSSSWSEQQATSRGASPPLRSASTGPATMRSSHDEDYLITATREELEEKLKRNLSDLDRMIRTIKE
ncbi:hypothetical protein TELCIR_02565, partial [Teladorsagia circumcincta]